MSEVTAVPLRPIAKGSLVKLWVGVAAVIAIGIGAAYMCIYGMEGPGGYQLFGRTIQVWNTYRQTNAFTEGKPWLLRFFDQIRFFPVSHDELTEWRRDFPLGRREIRIEAETFRLADYRAFLAKNAADIAQFQQTRQAAFDAERADWERRGEFTRVEALASAASASAISCVTISPAGRISRTPPALWPMAKQDLAASRPSIWPPMPPITPSRVDSIACCGNGWISAARVSQSST